MKKRLIALLLSGIVSFSIPVYADFDYSILDNMSKEELEELRDKVSDKITELKQLDTSTDTETTGIWTVKYFVDEFQQPTDEGYVSTSEFLEGTFSNTATTNSLLYVNPIFDENAAFKLLEYGDSIVKGYHSNGTEYDFTILAPSGEKVNMKGVLNNGGDRIILGEKYVPYFYDILNENGTVKISIVEHDRPSTKYLFEIEDSSFFNNVYLQIFDSVPHHYYGNGEEIDVFFDIDMTFDNSKPTLIIATNIPDGTSIHASIEQKWWIQGESGIVEDGICSIPFNDQISTGDAIISFTLKSDEQSLEIRELLGDSFENLTGDIAEQLKSKDGYVKNYDIS